MITTGEFEWDELLELIKLRQVVPVVGRDLLTVETTGGRELYHRLLAQKLAAELNLQETSLDGDYQLNEVAMAYLHQNRKSRRQRIYTRLKKVLDETPVEIPALLLKLAEITDFDLFISSSFDDLLARALNQVRHGGESATHTLRYSLNAQHQDLSESFGKDRAASVFQVFGAASPLPDYAVTDEDMLEFLHWLQDSEHRPKRLFDKLYDRNLLLIGCGFPNWLARFFIRTLSQKRLAIEEQSRFVVDREVKTDSRLMLFLSDLHMEIYPEGDPAEFVIELNRRWCERNPGSVPAPAASSPVSEMPEPMQADPVFLSYSRDDLTEVWKLHDALEQAGIDVWFDVNQLGGGDAWKGQIEDNIRNCSLFLPIISRNAVESDEGYYWSEWHSGIERAKRIAEDAPFIIPIIIDDTPPESPRTPSYFRDRQMERAPEGLPPPGLVDRLRQAQRQRRLRRRRQR